VEQKSISARELATEQTKKQEIFLCDKYAINKKQNFCIKNKKQKIIQSNEKNNFFCKCLHYFSSNEKLETHAMDFDLLMRKGVFSYEYIDCMDKLQDTCLPPR